MARTETVLTIFVASPGDVTEERNRLEDAVTDWNRTWARDQGLRLELFRWESDVFPGIGLDAQDVVNQQIPSDYDLFLGIMWSRFGTPTLRAGSGTVEEFEQALARRSSGLNEPGVFFYFKDAPVPPSKINVDQLKAVQEFKDRVGKDGVLRWDFVEPDQFEKLVALHITKFVQSSRHRRTQGSARDSVDFKKSESSEITTSPVNHDQVDKSNEDAGYLDQLEEFELRSAEVSDITNRFTEAQISLTERTTEVTAELQELLKTPLAVNVTKARTLIAGVAEKMHEYSEVLTSEVPLFRVSMNAAMAALTRAAMLSVEFNTAQTSETRAAAAFLLDAIRGAKQATENFRTSTLALPRVTKEMNVAKRQQSAAMESLIVEFESAEQLLVEGITLIDSLLSQSDVQ